jgi:VanZ family protein
MVRTIYRSLNMSPVRWLIAVAWMVFLTILLLQPLDNPVIPTGVKPAPPTFMREVYFSSMHALIFSITAIIWTWTLVKHFSIRTAMWITVIALFVYGIGTEFAQAQTPGRAPQRIDILANAVGITTGAWVMYKWLADFWARYSPPLQTIY